MFWAVENLKLPGIARCRTVRGEDGGVIVSSATCWGDTLDSLFVCLKPFNSRTIETVWLSVNGVCHTLRVGQEGITVIRGVCWDDNDIHTLIKIMNARISWKVNNLEVRVDVRGSKCAKCNNRAVDEGSPCALHTLLNMQREEKIVKNVIYI